MKAGWRTAWNISFGMLIGLLTTGILWMLASPPRGKAITLSPPPSPRPLMVHLSGEVLQPGVYALPPGSRIQDGIQAAGGLNAEADTSLLNFAAPLQDGERVHVPTKSLAPPASSSTNLLPPQETQASGGLPVPGGLININTASAGELESLPGIGPTLAQRIIEHRLAHGPFTTIEAIQDVSGIGPARFEQIKQLISVVDIP